MLINTSYKTIRKMILRASLISAQSTVALVKFCVYMCVNLTYDLQIFVSPGHFLEGAVHASSLSSSESITLPSFLHFNMRFNFLTYSYTIILLLHL